MLRGSRGLLVVMGLFAAACLDPLYQDNDPLTSGWVVCCQRGAIDTCFCDDQTSCERPVFACPSGACASNPQCIIEPTGGGTGYADAGTTGGGAGTGGGSATGGGAATVDGGYSDAGTGGGGGASEDAGTGGGGGSAPTGGGTGVSTGFEFCCVNSRVTSCFCPITGCVGAPFTPCPGGACVAGTSQSLCR